MADKLVIDLETGEQEFVPLTPEEEQAIADSAAENETTRIATQRAEAENVQAANVAETDWIITPPPDTPQDILNQINNNLTGWQTFRREVRALPVLDIPNPADLVWPSHPIRPPCALTPPPAFLSPS